ncbi:MAG: ABC transporter permease [bacterium]|nr:ABC transporter permease [bacterium]
MSSNLQSVSLATVARKSMRYFARSHLALAAGVAAATAVIVGALVVGDTVRYSLRSLVLNRLDNIECLLHARVFFDPQFLNGIQLSDPATAFAPAVLFQSTTVEYRDQGQLTRASRVQLLAVASDFWSQLRSPPADTPATDEVAINQSLANELGVQIGDELTILLDDPGGIPSDNPLGRRDGDTLSIPRQKVVAILSEDQIGGVNFQANQNAPRNIFVSLETVQDILECGSDVNAALALRASDVPKVSGQSICDEMNLQLRPRLEDYGLELQRHTRIFPDPERRETGSDAQPQTVYDYYQLTSSQLILDDATSQAVYNRIGEEKTKRLITYLANGITKVNPLPADLSEDRNASNFLPLEIDESNPGRLVLVPMRPTVNFGGQNSEYVNAPRVQSLSRKVPYSIIVGVDENSQLPLADYQRVPFSELKAPFCWINSWLAEQLEAQPGDWIQVDFFEPETVDGKEVEESVRFMIAGIVPITEPETSYRRSRPAQYAQAPTIFNDPNLTPNVEGITDQDSILNWDLPFKLENEISAVDDEYWNNYRLTPKVFMPFYLAVRPDLFASRFGDTTALKFSPDDFADEAELRNQIEEALLDTRPLKGLVFSAVKERQLQAASGTTPFDLLFLSLSFFVIVAALLLVYLLFKLSIQRRNSELGILLAQGYTPGRVRNLLLGEFTGVAILGTLAGTLLGLAYAKGIIAGLETWWIGAIATRFLTFHASAWVLLVGAASGFAACLAAIFVGIRKACQTSPLANLRGTSDEASLPGARPRKIFVAVAVFTALAAIGLMFAAMGQSGMAKAGTFFGSGMLLLVSAMAAIRQLIEPNFQAQSSSQDSGSGGLLYMAWRAVGRNPGRSLLSLSLLSVATFLIASMGVFQISPTEKGYGGFNLIAQSSQPIGRNIGSGIVRNEVLGEEAEKLSATTIVPMRARFAEDASCNNLFQVTEPTILGVSDRLREIHDFAPDSIQFEWAQSQTPENPWLALAPYRSGSADNPIPVILDQNTALWSLKQGAKLNASVVLKIDNREIHFRTVGLLSNSVLQGKLLISAENFKNLFPNLSGFSYFLINSGRRADPQVVAETLERGWANEGLDVQYSEDILARFLGVQNTYISAFQSLGALGLLLGTFGLIAVQVRSVLERRREFAVMRAVGFSPGRLASLLTLETAILLGGGLLAGILCASVALIPYIIEVGPRLSLLGPLMLLVSVLVVGFLAALIAVRAANKQSVLEGLRSE